MAQRFDALFTKDEDHARSELANRSTRSCTHQTEQLHLALAPASGNVAELAHLIGRLRQPVCGIRGRRLDERKRSSARSPIGHWHDTPRWLVTMSCQRHCCINPGMSARNRGRRTSRATVSGPGPRALPIPGMAIPMAQNLYTQWGYLMIDYIGKDQEVAASPRIGPMLTTARPKG
jgi:hypothetical protein